MKPSIRVVLGVVTAASLALAGCGGGDEVPEASTFPTDNVTITLAGWSLSTTPEFKTLADGFKALHPNVTVQLKEYDAAQYDTLMTADLSAGTAPDIITQKTFKNYYAYANGGALLDISDVAKKIPGTAAAYTVDGKTYGVAYRQDSWVLYYDKDLFDKAGVKDPDGTWTWDDYAKAAKDLTAGLKAAGSNATGAYQHLWQSTLQGFALAQSKGADLTKPDYSWLKPYYTRALDLQASGAQPTFGTATTAKLTYQAQFGKQSAAMMMMGTWYVATLLAQTRARPARPAPRSPSATRPACPSTGPSRTVANWPWPRRSSSTPPAPKAPRRSPASASPRPTPPPPWPRPTSRWPACRPTSCPSSPGPNTTPSRRTRSASTRSACRTC
jgi:multiple sugar transport system substrate-binding protein